MAGGAVMRNTEAILVTPGTMKIMAAVMPVPGEDEVVVQVACVGICGSDVHGFQYGPFIPPPDPDRKIGLGHEFSGTVTAVGKNVKKFKTGDRVLCEPGVPCGKCEYCRSGRYNICPAVDFMATQPNYRGALTNYLVHPASFTYHLPAAMDMVEGALVEPAAVGMHAAELGGVKPGKQVLILGAGCIGLMTLQACRLMGADQIVIADVIPGRLAMAKRLGATVAVNSMEEDLPARLRELYDGMGADIVFETAGAKATAAQAFQAVKRGGRIMIVGTIPGETPVDFLKINREVSIQTVFRYANNFPMTIGAIANGLFDVKSMVTDTYEYEEVQRAFEESVNRKAEIIKGVIRVSG